MPGLRQDLISGDWIIAAPGRNARPHFLDIKKTARRTALMSTCPFETASLQATGQWPPLLAYPNVENWRVIAFPNKYPALVEQHDGTCSELIRDGVYSSRTGVGEHDLIVTRDHIKNFAELAPRAAAEVFEVFQALCKTGAEDPCIVYVIPFMNWGLAAGASVGHPHYQFLSLPIVPAHTDRSLRGSEAYRKKTGHCARCDIVAFERKTKKRVVDENELAIAIAPYASKFPFEISVLLKKHQSSFYKTPPRELAAVAALVQSVMRRLKKYVNDPDLNFFIHEEPVDGKPHDYHHWHVEIIPRVSTPAGFELSTGIYINTVEPESAAKILRGRT